MDGHSDQAHRLSCVPRVPGQAQRAASHHPPAARSGPAEGSAASEVSRSGASLSVYGCGTAGRVDRRIPDLDAAADHAGAPSEPGESGLRSGGARERWHAGFSAGQKDMSGIQSINIGTYASDPTADSLPAAFGKVNNNFNNLPAFVPTAPVAALWPLSIARTVQQRLSDTLNIKDFGAVGDGTSHTLS